MTWTVIRHVAKSNLTLKRMRVEHLSFAGNVETSDDIVALTASSHLLRASAQRKPRLKVGTIYNRISILKIRAIQNELHTFILWGTPTLKGTILGLVVR